MAKKYKNIVPEGKKVALRKLGGLEIRGGMFYTQSTLKMIHDQGLTHIVELVEEKPKKRKTKKEDNEETTSNEDI